MQIGNDRERLILETDASHALELSPAMAIGQAQVVDDAEPTRRTRASPPGILTVTDGRRNARELSPKLSQFKSKLVLPALAQSHLSPLPQRRDKHQQRVSASLLREKELLQKQKQNT